MSEPKEPAADGVDGLFARARTGDQAAWRELFDACYPKVIRVIRRRLNSPAMRSLYDSTDFVGDVWTSLAEKRDRFDFASLAALQAFLAKSAERKVIDQHRKLQAQKNDVGRQLPTGSWSDGPRGSDPASRDPTPSQVAQATEVQERILTGQTGEDRRVIELRQAGYSNEEIVQKTGWNLRKIQRFLKNLSDSWAAQRVGGRP